MRTKRNRFYLWAAALTAGVVLFALVAAAIPARRTALAAETATEAVAAAPEAIAAPETAFETNLSDWLAVDGSIWSVTEQGFTSDMKSGIEDEPLKFLVKSGQKLDAARSFRYEVEFVIDGYGAGLSLYTGSRTNFYAVEVNVEGSVYFPSMSSTGWKVFADYGTPLSAEEKAAFNGKHSMILEYDAGRKLAKVTVDGVVRSEDVSIPGSAFGGSIGLYFEGCNSCCFTKALYTETGESGETVDLKDFFETNMEFETVAGGPLDYTAKGYGGTGGGEVPQCLAKSNVVIDGTKSFRYEVTFSYNGYGAGLGFNVVDANNYAAVELNVESHVYFPLKQEGNWQTFYPNAPDLDEEAMARSAHTLEFVFDAYDCYAQVYVDGELWQEIYDLDPEVISGSLGLFFEGATAYYTKAVYTELETRTPVPETPTEAATSAPATEVPATATPDAGQATATADNSGSGENNSSGGNGGNGADGSNGELGKILLIVGAGVLAAAAVVVTAVLVKRKKH